LYLNMPFTYRKTDSVRGLRGACSPSIGVRRRAGICVTLLTLGACTPPIVHSGSSGVASLVASRTGWRPEWNDDSAALGLRIPAGPLEPESAARLAVLRSPRVRVTLADVGIAAADLWQASLLPNPLASYSYGFPPSGAPFVSAGLGFAIVDALKIPMRKRVAEAAYAATEQRVADAVIGATLDAHRAYTLVQHAQQMLELRKNIAAATSAAALTAQGLRDAGNVPALLLAGEQSIAAQSELEVAQAEGDLAPAPRGPYPIGCARFRSNLLCSRRWIRSPSADASTLPPRVRPSARRPPHSASRHSSAFWTTGRLVC
jgi:hypothetical protein